MSDFTHKHYTAGRKAVKSVFNCEPDMTREGGSIPVTLTLQVFYAESVSIVFGFIIIFNLRKIIFF